MLKAVPRHGVREARSWLQWIALLAVVLLFAGASPAGAGPATVTLNAGGCIGYGQSWLSYPAGYTGTTGCSGSSRYLSGTVVLQNGTSRTLAGGWYSGDIVWGNIGNPSPVTAAAGTHALQFITAFDGYYGTNTW